MKIGAGMNHIVPVNTHNNALSLKPNKDGEAGDVAFDFAGLLFDMVDVGANIEVPGEPELLLDEDVVMLEPDLVALVQSSIMPIANNPEIEKQIATPEVDLDVAIQDLIQWQDLKAGAIENLPNPEVELLNDIVNQKTENLTTNLKGYARENVVPIANNLIQQVNDKIDAIIVNNDDVEIELNIDWTPINPVSDNDNKIELIVPKVMQDAPEKELEELLLSEIARPEVGEKISELALDPVPVRDDSKKPIKLMEISEPKEFVPVEPKESFSLPNKIKFDDIDNNFENLEIKPLPVNDNKEVVQAPKPRQMEKMPTVTEQIKFVIDQSVAKGDSKILLKLYPEELGKLEISFDKTADEVKVSFLVEKSETLDLLQAEIGSLEKVLSYAGIKSENTKFNFDLMPQFHNFEQNQQMAQNNNRYKNSIEDETVENGKNLLEITANYYHFSDERVDIRI
jgi:hypothetical protein